MIRVYKWVTKFGDEGTSLSRVGHGRPLSVIHWQAYDLMRFLPYSFKRISMAISQILNPNYNFHPYIFAPRTPWFFTTPG